MKLRSIAVSGSILFLAVLAGFYAFRQPARTPLAPVAPTISKSMASPAVPAMETATPAIDWDQRISNAKSSGFADLMDKILELQDHALRSRLMGAMFQRWIREDSRTMVAYFDRLEVNRSLASLALCYDSLRDQLTKLDATVEADDTVIVLIERLVTHLAATDPEQALGWAEKYLLEDTRQSALATISAGIARQDEERALEVADRIISPLRRFQALANIGAQWAARDGAAALQWATELDETGSRALTVNSVLLVLAREDTENAAVSLAETARVLTADYLVRRKETLAAANLTEADIVNDTEAYRDMMTNGAIPGPESPDAELLSEAGKVIAGRLAATDPPDAVAWADALESSYLRLTSLAGAIDVWAGSDPIAAVDYIIAQQEANPALLDAAYAAWGRADPAAAAEGVSRISSPHDRNALLNTVVKAWAAGTQSATAVTWLNGQPAGMVPDALKMTVATSLAERAPEEAWKVATSIQNPSSQARALSSVFSHLIFSDIKTAATLLQTASLPGQTSQLLSEMLESVGTK